MEALLVGRGFKIHKRHDPGDIIVGKFWTD